MKLVLNKVPLFSMLAISLSLLGPSTAYAQAKPSPSAGAQKEIAFGMISSTGNEDYKKRWKPLLDELGAQTGMRVTATASPNIVEDIKEGKIQIAWLSNKAALDAVATGKMKIFAQMMKEDGSVGYSSVLIVPKDSPINSTEDLFKKPGTFKLGYGDPNSTTGYLVPNIFLFKKANIDPARHFKSVIAQGPRANFLAAVNKQVDVAVNNTEDMEIFRKEMPDKFKEIKVIWTSQPMPDHPMLVSRDMPDALRAKVEEFFLKYGSDKANAAHMATLKNIRGLSGFRKSDNGQLKPVSILEMHNEIGKVEANAALSPEEKKQRLAEISSRMQKINTLISGQ